MALPAISLLSMSLPYWSVPRIARCGSPMSSVHMSPGARSPRSRFWALAMGVGSGLSALPPNATTTHIKIHVAPNRANRCDANSFTPFMGYAWQVRPFHFAVDGMPTSFNAPALASRSQGACKGCVNAWHTQSNGFSTNPCCLATGAVNAT